MKTRLFFLFIALSFFAQGQQVKLNGVVRDSLAQPLELASLVAINKASNALDAYTMTDANGNFSLKLKTNTSYKIQVSALGLQTINDSLTTAQTNLIRDYELRADIVLDEVVVKMPVLIRGDTLIYDADSFKNGSERKLEDIIDKLPGVEINDSGQIEVEGKVVNKLMVNGKDFFDGDTKIATKNIPSSTVDKIQVLKNYGEVGQLRGVGNNQDNVAINIKLKQGKESFWFGNVTTGAGDSPKEELYLVQPKLFYYSPKYSINFIGDMNNIGEVALSRRDIRGFGGGFRSPSRQSGTSINLGDNSLNFLTNQNNAQRIENKLATGNFSYSPNEKLDLTGFIIFNSSIIDAKENSFIQYTDSRLQIPDETTEETSEERSNQGLLKLSASYKPNFNNQVDYDILVRASDDRQQQNVLSSVIGRTAQLEEVTPFSINQNLNYYFTLNEDNIFAFEAQHLLKNEDPFYNANLANDPNGNDAFDRTATALGLATNLNGYDLGQNRKIFSNQLDAKLDYYHIINPKSNLNLTLGTILSHQSFESSIFQFLDQGTRFQPTPSFNNGLASNDVEYNFSDLYLGMHYRFRTGKFTFTPGFSIHAYGNNNQQNNILVEDNFIRFLPDFETRIQIKKGESLTLNYRIQNQFTDVTRLAQGLVLNNYNSLQYGEPDLQNALSHNISLLYSSFNLFNYTNVFARVSYTSNIDQIRSLTNFESIIRTSTFFNSNFADENFNAFGRIQRTFGKIRASLNAAFNYSKINQFIQGIPSLNEGFTQTLTPGIRTNFKVAPNVSLRYRYSVINNDQGSRTTKFIVQSPSIEFDAYIWEKITLVSNFSYTRQDLGSQVQSFQNWDAGLSYRKDKDAKWEFELKASNILNIDAQVRNSANNLSVFNAQTFIQPRFITLRGVYNL
ncbi:MAG: carboxypeptidase regulatory-like domain-containing protein [Flavobacteriaceae bacterium]|nr:carboxypeptidase regulatory-like domain-containing protein [Flavobacteriaceae bacterium]